VSRSLTVTDPQPNSPSLIQPNHYSSQVSTNHVRVHAAHNRERGCYNSFTLCRGCTHSPWVVIILEKLNTHCIDVHPYTLPRCVLGNHYKTVQWLYLACNIPTEVSLLVWASHPPRSPLLCLMGSSCHSFTEHPSGSAITAFPHHRLVCQDWTLPHTMPGRTHIGSWLYYFHEWSLHEPVFRFGYDNQPRAFSIAPDKSLEPPASHRQVPNPITPNPILNTSRIQIFIIMTGVT
jgi:hypothetical protein